MTEKLLVKNARIVNEGKITESDLLIESGRIEKLAASINGDGAEVLDAQGLLLLPGMIDDQVHFREPHKGGIRSESRAAAAGGITSYMEMPNTLPPTVTLDALEAKYAVASEKSLANYGFYLGATNDNLDVIRSLPVGTAAGIKIFMGASTGNMLVDNEETLAGIFREAPALIATHCEGPVWIRNPAERTSEYSQCRGLLRLDPDRDRPGPGIPCAVTRTSPEYGPGDGTVPGRTDVRKAGDGRSLRALPAFQQ
jgi:dihydroorotase